MAIQAAALLAALGPQIKAMIAAEALDLVRKYMFNGSTKGGRELNSQMYGALEKALGEMSDKDWQKLLKKKTDYRKSAGQWLKELGTSAAGTALDTWGNVWNIRNSIMADTINKALGNLVTPGEAAMWGNPYQLGGQLNAGSMLAQGAMADAIGRAAGGWLNNLSQKLSTEYEQDRMYRRMLENPLTGEGYRTLRYIGRRDGGDGSAPPAGARNPRGPTPLGGGGAAYSPILGTNGMPLRR